MLKKSYSRLPNSIGLKSANLMKSYISNSISRNTNNHDSMTLPVIGSQNTIIENKTSKLLSKIRAAATIAQKRNNFVKMDDKRTIIENKRMELMNSIDSFRLSPNDISNAKQTIIKIPSMKIISNHYIISKGKNNLIPKNI